MTASSNSNTRQSVQDLVYSGLGILFICFALKSLLVPNHFFDGGVTGISLLLHESYDINVAFLIILVNIPFIIMGGYLVGRKFAIKTFIAIICLGSCLLWAPFPVITHDKLIIALFGGFFLGLGIGLGMRGGCALDGIEILAVYTHRYIGLSMSEIILGLNVLIFLIAAIFFGLETAFYSMLTYYAASKTMDYVVEGVEEYTGVTIIAQESEAVKEFLVMKMHKGITVYKGERGFMQDSFDTSVPCDIIFTVITRLEVRKLKNAIHDIDPKAFVFSSTIKETAGGILKRKASH